MPVDTVRLMHPFIIIPLDAHNGQQQKRHPSLTTSAKTVNRGGRSRGFCPEEAKERKAAAQKQSRKLAQSILQR
jgi:hypothetical protein